MIVGKAIYRAVLFPYANKIITNYLDKNLNEKFGLEFSKIMDRTIHIIADHMLEPVSEKKLEEQISRQY